MSKHGHQQPADAGLVCPVGAHHFHRNSYPDTINIPKSETKMIQKSPYSYLGQITVLEVCAGHAVQPGPSQFGGAGVGPSQAVLQVQQHFWVFFMLSHLGCGHQHCTDPLGQTLHFWRECCGLKMIQIWAGWDRGLPIFGGLCFFNIKSDICLLADTLYL